MDRLKFHVQAELGQASAISAELQFQDPLMREPDTLLQTLEGLEKIKAAIALAWPHKSLDWLTWNGSIIMVHTALPLLKADFTQEALPFLVFAALALEANIIFSSSPKYLPWTLQLSTILSRCFLALQQPHKAEEWIAKGFNSLEQLEQLLRLDPVPAAPEALAACRSARTSLVILRVSLQSSGADERTLRTLLEGLPEQPDQLKALLEVVRGACAADHQPCSEPRATVFRILSSLILEHLESFRLAAASRKEPDSLGVLPLLLNPIT